MPEIENVLSPPAAAPKWARSFAANWHVAECLVAVAAFTFIAVVLLLDVIGRELLGPLVRLFGVSAATGIFASQKMSVYALVIGAFAGIGIATATGSHLVPRVLFGVVPPRWSPALNRLADLLTGLFLVGVSYFGLVFVESSFATDLRAPVLNWAVWPFQLAIPLGFISAALRYFLYALWPDLRPIPPAVQE
jgi:TRAP-type C4-dicarboxylate transport system permease small subunit